MPPGLGRANRGHVRGIGVGEIEVKPTEPVREEKAVFLLVPSKRHPTDRLLEEPAPIAVLDDSVVPRHRKAAWPEYVLVEPELAKKRLPVGAVRLRDDALIRSSRRQLADE